MMIACQVARSNAKTPQAIQPGQFRLNFGGDKPMSRAERDKRALEVRDARVAARGGLGKYTIVDAQGNIVRPPTEPLRNGPSFKNPLLRPPTADEVRAFRDRQRGVVNPRNPRSSTDGKR